VYSRTDARTPWRQRPGLNRFELFTPARGGRTELHAGPCPNPGDYRIDLYLEGVYVASSKTAPASPAAPLIGYEDPVSSFSMCRPTGWKLTTQPGMVEARSKEGQSISASVLPAPLELSRAGAPQLTAALDSLAAHKGFELAAGPPQHRTLDGVAGLVRSYRRAGSIDRQFEGWASVQPGAVLHVVLLDGYFDDDQLFRRLLEAIRFNPR
jgi:hypothetical protein